MWSPPPPGPPKASSTVDVPQCPLKNGVGQEGWPPADGSERGLVKGRHVEGNTNPECSESSVSHREANVGKPQRGPGTLTPAPGRCA